MSSESCNTQGECAPKSQCAPQPGASSDCPMPGHFLTLADEAWRELFIEKLKAEIEVTCGEKMTALAKVVHTANKQKWEHEIQGRKACADYQNEVKNLMVSNCAS